MEQETVRSAGKKAGTLTIFAGYFSGTGKTWAMLRAAREAREEGLDVVIGLVEENWPRTAALARKFETLPSRQVMRSGKPCRELDLDACLRRKPQLVIIDQLSHRNGEDSRHMRRYQDIEELLKSGMDVYTTLDIQQIESLQDTVDGILGQPGPERIPDRVFDRAGRVEFVDIEPDQLSQRWADQDRRLPVTLSQLSALREMGLRRCADRAGMYREGEKSGEYRTREHILVCLSSAPSNGTIIRTAARMAAAFRCSFTALFVETKEFQGMSAANKERLQANIHLAQQLGATVETVYGDDVAYQIAEFSRLAGVTKIVLGRSLIPRRNLIRKSPLTERLIELSPQLDIHIIPDTGMTSRLTPGREEVSSLFSLSPLDLAKSILILLGVTGMGFLFYAFDFSDANIITLYILGVMLISVFTRGSICSLMGSIASVLAFNFFFTQPRFSLHAYDRDYTVTFLIMFLAALLTGSLASRLKSLAKHSAQVAWRTRLLFETSQSLQRAGTRQEILSTTAKQLLKIFQRDILAYAVGGEGLEGPALFSMDPGQTRENYTVPREVEAAQWAAANRKRAGAGTQTLSDAQCTYYAVWAGDRVYGVVGIASGDKPLDSFENSILLSVLGECALALENRWNLEEKEAAALLAKNEQLRANLLRSISHDLRTPLTSISGNASNLLSNGALFDEKTKNQMYSDIYEDSIWLINLVENLLSVSRLEEGRMNLHLSTELMDDVVGEALRHISRKRADYQIQVENSEDYLLARIDARLIVQVIINLVDNAIKYTPPGSRISIGWKQQGQFIAVWVADNGPGISAQAKPHIFDMFYTAANQIADSRRSMGLGLALCKSIVNAHGGEISVADQKPHGSIFTFTVPAGEVELHE